MPTETKPRNEPAERLRAFGRSVPMPDPMFRLAFMDNVDAALREQTRTPREDRHES